MIEDVDLRFPTDPVLSESRQPGEIDPDAAIRALTALPLAPAVPVVEAENEAEEEATEDAETLESALFEGLQESDAVPVTPLDPEQTSIPDESTALSEISFEVANQPPPESPAAALIPELQPDQSWRRLARSLSHEIRHPLVSIRTFAELLPEHFEDETFRARFTELVGKDVEHIGDVLTRLSKITESESSEAGPVDV